MAGSRRRVAYADSEGSHSVELNADILYEAVAMAVAEFKHDPTISNQPGAMTEFTIAVHRPPVEHKNRLQQVAKWAEPSTWEGSAGITERERVRALLGQP